MRLWNAIIISSLLVSIPEGSLSLNPHLLSQAQDLRTHLGHDAAQPLYQQILKEFPQDLSTAVRIAASSQSLQRQDKACPIPIKIQNEDDQDETKEYNVRIRQDIAALSQLFKESHYTNGKVKELFGIIPPTSTPRDHPSGKVLMQGPVFLKPIRVGSQALFPFVLEDEKLQESSLKCLIAMFLLGFCIPYNVLQRYLIGGEETIGLLQRLGLAFVEETDGMVVPYVHLFPMDVAVISNENESNDKEGSSSRMYPMVLVTDCHPTILSTTTVGTRGDGAVMYIGPDSLALVQHLPLEEQVQRMHHRARTRGESMKGEEFRLVDFCTGSGVQALSTLISLRQVFPQATAVCVDINSRALRFTTFNALLNKIDLDSVHTLKGDLLQQVVVEDSKKDSLDRKTILDQLVCNGKCEEQNTGFRFFDMVLANPPFIPVPPVSNAIDGPDRLSSGQGGERNSIDNRYGLFSSGGSSGEEILKSILQMSSKVLKRDGGFCAIVSEFMNPPFPTTTETMERGSAYEISLLEKISQWWQEEVSMNEVGRMRWSNMDSCHGEGILFTNEYPVPYQTYAERRGNNSPEVLIWKDHLKTLGIKGISPGLLYIETREDKEMLDVSSIIVPKTKDGSIWTPHNFDAITVTKRSWGHI